MSSDLQSLLRRIKPEKRTAQLNARNASELSFVDSLSGNLPKLLYDTTVYIDVLQGRFPANIEFVLRTGEPWHSTVTESELTALCGLLDPANPGTRKLIDRVIAIVERRHSYRTIAPDREIWCEAGILAGLLARLQGYGPIDRRRVLNDALLFSTARKHGLAVLTRNLRDFDFLQQLVPTVRVLFYTV